MSIVKAVVLHFLISASIVSCVLACIFFIWYPSPMFEINGASDILRILIGVDLILGPLLTAVLYRPGKKNLKFDLSVVAIVQLTALIYGTTIIYSERPQYMVFSMDRFTVLTGGDVRDPALARARCADSDRNPCVQVVTFDDTVEERARLVQFAMEEQLEPEQLPEYWTSLATSRDRVLERAQPLEVIIAAAPAFGNDVRDLTKKHDRALSEMVFVPIVNRKLDGYCLVIDAKTAETLDVIRVDPWEWTSTSDDG